MTKVATSEERVNCSVWDSLHVSTSDTAYVEGSLYVGEVSF